LIQNLEERLKWHNEGRVNFTSKYLPWIRVHYEEYSTRSEAMKREKYLKTGAGREWIKNNVKLP